MPNTQGAWTQDSASNDLQIFISADEIRNTSGAPVLTLNANGDFSLNQPVSSACVYMASSPAFVRTGMLASAATSQQQFGTAAAQPGPSAVPGTSDPLALKAGYPPIPSSQLATMGAFNTGPAAKGMMVNSIDVIYQITGGALTTHVIGMTRTTHVNNVANAIVATLAKAANGLATAAQANPYVTNIPMTVPSFLNVADTASLIELDVTTPAGVTYKLYGFVLRCSFNLN